ncbi:MAG: PAS domain S-box protein [Deltaproteobacteria bacterium]|nr:PAS domain S-box protein [Deltaproteobacteria bacterium]
MKPEGPELYRQLFKSGNDAFFVHRIEPDGRTGTFIEVNDVACTRLGYTREELLQLTVHEINFDPAMPHLPGVIRRLHDTGHAVFETVHVTKDGRQIPVEISSQLFTLEGQPTILSIARDLTERKRADESLSAALHESRRRTAEVAALLKAARSVLEHQRFKPAARAIFDACREAIGAPAGYVAMMAENGEWNDLLFLDAGGAPCTVDPSLPMPVRGLRAEAYRTMQVVYENDFLRSAHAQLLPPGHAALQNVMFAPMVLQGRAVGLLGLANKPGGFTGDDARMASAFGELAAVAFRNSRILDDLAENEEKYRNLFHGAQVGMYRSRLDGSGILEVNDRLAAILGATKEELLKRPVLFNWARSEEREKLVGELCRTGSVAAFEMDAVTGGGDIRTCLVSARLFPDKGIIEGTVVDITDRKRTAEALRERTIELEAFNEAMVGREARIIEMKEEINRLCAELGKEPKYPPVWRETGTSTDGNGRK